MRALLATDGSPSSEAAARVLKRFNWSPQDSITVFHAIYAVPFPEDRKFHFDTLAAIKKDLAPRILDSAVEALNSVRARVSVDIEEFFPGECTPDQCILKAAEAAHADLIVMGARGVRGAAFSFIGSVTRLVAMHSPLPVLVAKAGADGPAPEMRVLLAADGSGPSQAAAGLLASLPLPEEAAVTVLHVISSAFSDIPERFAAEVSDRVKEAVAGARAREFAESETIIAEARNSLGKRFRSISSLSRVGDPSTEIVDTAGVLKADMIVTGCRGLRGVTRMLTSVTRNVLANAPCSVLVGKAAER